MLSTPATKRTAHATSLVTLILVFVMLTQDTT
jgi:hypothetical protein